MSLSYSTGISFTYTVFAFRYAIICWLKQGERGRRRIAIALQSQCIIIATSNQLLAVAGVQPLQRHHDVVWLPLQMYTQ
jgi:hypothetical protein